MIWRTLTNGTVYCHCVYHRSGPAEELPFSDGSVDLLTAASAAHWFDTERFLSEAARVLKPHGCIALLGYTDEYRLNYGSCGDRLNIICAEVRIEGHYLSKNWGHLLDRNIQKTSSELDGQFQFSGVTQWIRCTEKLNFVFTHSLTRRSKALLRNQVKF